MKLAAFQTYLREQKIDTAFFHNLDEKPNMNLYYFSQYTGAGVLLIPQTGKPVLVVPELDVPRAEQTKCKVVPWGKKRLFEVLGNTIKKNSAGTVGIDKSHITLSWHSLIKKHVGKKIVDIQKELVQLRRQKTKQEQDIIKEACKQKCAIFNKMIDQWSSFKTETDVAAWFQYAAAKKGYGLSFPTIVASGKNAASPHYEPQNKALQKGFCVVDCGIKVKEYCTDMTRTVFVGTPTKKEKEQYENIRSVQEQVMKQYMVGRKVAELDAFVRKQLGKQEKYFIHSLGHGVGLDIHESPHISSRSKEVLQEHEYVTNEPGVYVPKSWGIRIEDDLLTTKKGPVVLTKQCTKDLIAL